LQLEKVKFQFFDGYVIEIGLKIYKIF